MSSLPHIAILGRPNVGKSTLFNRLVGRRHAIVSPVPGITRDRIEGEFRWRDRTYKVSDLAGWDERKENPFASEILAQIESVARHCDVILLVVDGKEGLTAWDKDIAEKIRHTGKPVIVVVNKCDTVKKFSQANEFFELGLGDPIPISATHNLNIIELLERIAELTQWHAEEAIEEEIPRIAVAIVGRQNVGKSTLFNALVGEHRAIVSEIPGTTRDAVDTAVDVGESHFLFIDTAGLKKRSKIAEAVEFYASVRTQRAIERCHVAVLLIDASEGVTDTDLQIAGVIKKTGKGCIIAASKWDLSEDLPRHREEFIKHVRKRMHFLWYAPVVFTSGLRHIGISSLFPAIEEVYEEYHKRISTSLWNKALQSAVEYRPPPTMRGKQLKLKYITQTGTAPPTLTLFVNQPEFLKKPYLTYLEKRFREEFGFEGAPLVFNIRRGTREEFKT